MKNNIKLIIGLIFGIVSVSRSQSLYNQVINSAGGGGAVGTTGYFVYYNIGESVINTIQSTSNTVTQGFLQPGNFGVFDLSVTNSISHISCLGRKDGAISLTPTVSAPTSTAPITYQYFWSPPSVCPTNNCQTIDSLQAGVYSVTVVATNGTQKDSSVVSNIVINNNTSPCLTLNPSVSQISCVGKMDGAIVLSPSVAGISSTTSVSYQYIWAPSSLSLCPSGNCQSIDSLKAGVYSVTVIATYGSQIDTATYTNVAIIENLNPCLLEVFNGMTPNGDGKNDFFYIGNIDQFPGNIVSVYNRWGQLMSRITDYNNMDNKWNGYDKNNNPAPSGTYFYVIELGNSDKPVKGWIELIAK